VVPATPGGIFVLIAALLEHRSTKTALLLRFYEGDYPMNPPLDVEKDGRNTQREYF
jgi:hypothetical protein